MIEFPLTLDQLSHVLSQSIEEVTNHPPVPTPSLFPGKMRVYNELLRVTRVLRRDAGEFWQIPSHGNREPYDADHVWDILQGLKKDAEQAFQKDQLGQVSRTGSSLREMPITPEIVDHFVRRLFPEN